jgi:TonB family protein
MSTPALSVSPALSLNDVPGSGASVERGSFQAGRKASSLFQAPREDHFALAWATALSSCVLAIGILGCFQPEILLQLTMSGAAGKPGSGDVVETTMAELVAMSETTQQVQETVLRPEVATPEVVTEPVVLPDLPELLPALTQEDVFEVPSAPPVEEALKPIDPAPKPTVRKPAPPAPPRSSSSSSSSMSGRSSSSSGSSGRSSSGGGSGSGSASSGSGGRGSFPQPSYPSYARSRGMQGTVTLTISVASNGSVTSTRVSGSSGHSTLDQHAASWVRRYWKFPGGAAKTYRVPIVFRLR